VYLKHHQIYEQRERDYCNNFFKKKKDNKEKESQTGASISDNITAKSNEDLLSQKLKIRINFNILSKGHVQI
jgi:hypothetical protein